MKSLEIIQLRNHNERSSLSIVARNYRTNIERVGVKPPSQYTVKEDIKNRIKSNFKENGKLNCYYCNKKIIFYGISNLIPFSKGGETNFSNAVIACIGCSSTKGTSLPEEFMRPLS